MGRDTTPATALGYTEGYAISRLQRWFPLAAAGMVVESPERRLPPGCQAGGTVVNFSKVDNRSQGVYSDAKQPP